MRTKPGLIDIGVVSSAIVEAAFEFPGMAWFLVVLHF